MSTQFLIMIVVAMVAILLIVYRAYGHVIKSKLEQLSRVNVAEMIDGLNTAVVIASKAMPKVIELTNYKTRKHLLAIWYFYAIYSPEGINSEHETAFKEAWASTSEQIRLEAIEAYSSLSMEYRVELSEQIASLLRRKEIDMDKLMEVLKTISRTELYLEYCDNCKK